jgi:Uma2 family endonuclease
MNHPAKIGSKQSGPVDAGLFSAHDFERMIAAGAFDNMRVELVAGEIEKMAPAYGDHGSVNGDLYAALKSAYAGKPVWLAVDLALRIAEFEVRGADIAVVRGGTPMNRAITGDEAILVVEIADTTLRRDRVDKAASYASAGVLEYWVVDLASKSVRIFTEPSQDGYARHRDAPFSEDLRPPQTDQTVRIG